MPAWCCPKSEANLRLSSSAKAEDPVVADASTKTRACVYWVPAGVYPRESGGGHDTQSKEARMNIIQKTAAWQPPESVAREEIVARSSAILANPDLPLR